VRYVIAAGLLSFLFAVGTHVYDCQTGTHEQCLMSRGFFWAYWLVSFLVAWAVVASFGALIQSLGKMGSSNDDG
jgi:hypothetical protein